MPHFRNYPHPPSERERERENWICGSPYPPLHTFSPKPFSCEDKSTCRPLFLQLQLCSSVSTRSWHREEENGDQLTVGKQLPCGCFPLFPSRCFIYLFLVPVAPRTCACDTWGVHCRLVATGAQALSFSIFFKIFLSRCRRSPSLGLLLRPWVAAPSAPFLRLEGVSRARGFLKGKTCAVAVGTGHFCRHLCFLRERSTADLTFQLERPPSSPFLQPPPTPHFF